VTVKELRERLEDFGDHLQVKLHLEEITKYGQHAITDVETGRDHEDGSTILELRID
jgi:hypothetical protein